MTLPTKINANIDVRSNIPQLVPEYECLEACIFSGYTWEHWLNDLDANDRITAVAHYRMHHLIEAHIQEAAERGSKNRPGANRR